jgi:MFS family permease
MKTLRRYLPHLVVFVSSMGVMIIELVASRLISKYFGSSLYTWTGIIGVVLGGISLGNFIGGRLADRYPPRNIIAILLLIASFTIRLSRMTCSISTNRYLPSLPGRPRWGERVRLRQTPPPFVP